MLNPIVALIILCISLWSASAQAAFMAIEAGKSNDVIEMNLGNAEVQKVFFLTGPPRLVVDASLSSIPTISLPKAYKGKLLKAVRAGRFDADTVRIVFDLKTPATILSQDEEGGLLSITIAPASARGEAKAKSTVQLPLIVIDPGHGGNDPGAIGPRGTQEKDVVLAFAKALKQSLNATEKYRVLLTRDNDVFIPLRERVNIARKAGGAIFISLHADSAPSDDARGLSVYTVSEKASDAEAAALAARENKVDVLGGMDLSNEREDVADILISLAQRDTKNQSSSLADQLVLALQKKQVKTLVNTHRFAGFAVLKAPDIPSVLIETGFISHPEEEKLLKTKSYRDRLMEGITSGLDAYFRKKNALP